jgi:hypothetical protein
MIEQPAPFDWYTNFIHCLSSKDLACCYKQPIDVHTFSSLIINCRVACLPVGLIAFGRLLETC